MAPQIETPAAGAGNAPDVDAETVDDAGADGATRADTQVRPYDDDSAPGHAPNSAPAPLAPPVSVLMYHQVGLFPRPDKHRAVFCHVRRFRAQMRWLRFGGYNVISVARLVRCLFHGEPIPRRAVVLTFDDGCANFREHAWPVLREFGYPATMFLIAGKLGGTTDWMTDMPASTHAPLMSAADIRALHAEGAHFGSHTLSHPRLSQLPPARQRAEIFDAKARLEDLLGAPVPDFCYPYGDYDARARDFAAEAGHRSAFTCLRASANHAPNPLEIPRKAVSHGDTVPGLWWKLHCKNTPKQPPAARAANAPPAP